MNCFPCFSSHKKSQSKREHVSAPPENMTTKAPDIKKQKADEPTQADTPNIQAKAYTFRELATATKNFRQECLLGEGGFGRAYKGTIPTTGQVVAVKQLDRNGLQGSKEFLAEVSSLSLLHHENLVDLIGYCADGDQRLLVYEFMPGGSVEDRLLGCGPEKPPLDWFARIKIAVGAGKGLEYLHEQANPPIIYRDLKSSNILLDDNLNPRLSDFGLAKLSGGDKANAVPSRVVGTYGYCAPEYVSTGQLTLKSDVYSFGVVLLELITGRRVIDTTKPNNEQNLVSWAQPLFRDPKRFPDMADPLLNKCFPEKDLNQAVAVAAMCLQEEAAARPLMSDIVTTLSFLSVVPPEDMPAPSDPKESVNRESEKESHSSSSSNDEDGDTSNHDHNQTTKIRVTFSENYQDSESDDSDVNDKSDSDDSDVNDKSDKENQSLQASQGSNSSRKNSTKSRTGSRSSSRRSGSFTSDDASVSSSHKSSKKSHNSSQKKSKNGSVKVPSSKSSLESEDGSVLLEHNQSKASDGNASSRRTSSIASDAESDLFERRASQGNSQGSLDYTSSRRSDHDVN